MSVYSAIDLAQLPAPAVVEQVDFESILSAMRDYLIELDPTLEGVLALESEPATIILEALAYRETVWRAQANDSARAVMLAYAGGSDLDHLGALVNVERQVVQEADPEADPPVLEILESDERLRQRIQLAPESWTVAGSSGAYRFHALSADPTVADVYVYAPESEGNYIGEVRVTILSSEGDGEPDAALLLAVTEALSDETVRPLTDRVYVEPATIVEYEVTAGIYTFEGPDPTVVLAAAQASVEAYVASMHRLGHDIPRSGVFAALHVAGVQRVALTAPAADLSIAATEAPYCTAITLTDEGTAL